MRFKYYNDTKRDVQFILLHLNMDVNRVGKLFACKKYALFFYQKQRTLVLMLDYGEKG
ncbi:hypothetical protein BACPU_23180 [Bacillus pumilus]|nr:hypothetical protein BACPU_23180 [Bacillus pumilus]